MGKFFEGVYEELRLYVRQSAWLNAVPEQRGINAGERKSRLTRFQDENIEVELPEVDLGYLVAHLWSAGPTMHTAMGESPLTHGELESWMHLTGVELQPWEVRALIRLSYDYLVQGQQSEKPDCVAPYMKLSTRRAHVASKVDEIFG